MKFLLWCVLLILCWPLALFALVLYPIVWVLLLPFRLVGIAVHGVLELVAALIMLPARLLRPYNAQPVFGLVSGPDFSRAVNGANRWASGPECCCSNRFHASNCCMNFRPRPLYARGNSRRMQVLQCIH